MGKFVDLVINKKPNEFKTMIQQTLGEKIVGKIQEKRIEVGKSMFKSKMIGTDNE